MNFNSDQTVYFVDYREEGCPVVPIKWRDFLIKSWNDRAYGKVSLDQKPICHETMTGAELERLEALEKREV